MGYVINYSNESLVDLFNIYDYIANVANEKANALKLVDAIRNDIKKLDVFPLKHPVVTFSPWKELGIRYLVAKKHIAFYYVDEKKHIVNIIRIFSSKQDVKNIIKKESQ